MKRRNSLVLKVLSCVLLSGIGCFVLISAVSVYVLSARGGFTGEINSLIWLSAGSAFLVSILLALLLARVLLRPFSRLIRGIETWDGLRLPDMGGLEKRRDEIGLLAETFAAMAGEIRIKTRSLEEQAVRDGLTGLFNRRQFDAVLGSEWDRHRRNDLPLSLIMLDIDGFKDYNDVYGRQAGDDCLRRIGRACETALKRPGDVLFRYGGEEFAVILADTDSEGALKVAASLREEIAALGIPHGKSPVSDRITVSIGTASCLPGKNGECEDRGSLLRRADKALYAAKESGRDRIVGG